jgi:hypothetical protein
MLFDRRFAAPSDWPDFPEVRRTVDWFRSMMSDEEWSERRDKAARRLFNAAQGNRPELGEQGRFFDAQDTFAWYLFLAESYLDHPLNYEYIFGSRVLPIFEAIGRSSDALIRIPGAEGRVRKMVGEQRGQPNGTLFELLVAAAYLREGYSVVMVPERPGQQRTHDLDVERNGVDWAVECKRMETSEYGERERKRMRELWIPCAEGFAGSRLSVQCEADFRVPIERVPLSYFSIIVERWAGAVRPYAWDDAIGQGSIRRLDLDPLSAVLANDAVASPSTRLIELLTEKYLPSTNYITSLRAKPWDHPRYLSACDVAIVLRWESSSTEALTKKARDGLTHISRAVGQLPADRHCVVHVGFEAVNGDATERARLDRFRQSMNGFDPGGVGLEYVYAHCLVPESPPHKAWLFRETGSWHGVRPKRERPLHSPLLVLPPGTDVEGGHWDYRGAWGDE